MPQHFTLLNGRQHTFCALPRRLSLRSPSLYPEIITAKFAVRMPVNTRILGTNSALYWPVIPTFLFQYDVKIVIETMQGILYSDWMHLGHMTKRTFLKFCIVFILHSGHNIKNIVSIKL